MTAQDKRKKKLRRFFSSQTLNTTSSLVELSAEETHHLRNILRLKAGDLCLLTDGSGIEIMAQIEEFLKDGRARLILRQSQSQPVSKRPFAIRLVPALVKRGVLDEIVEKCQELGIDAFQAVSTERSDFDLTREKEIRVVNRWEKKVREAAKQSGQLFLTQIDKPANLKEALSLLKPFDRAAVFHPGGTSILFNEWIEKLKANFCGHHTGERLRLHLFFGPEGGFSDAEIAFFKRFGEESKAPLDIVGLGDSILRLETAVYSVAGSLRLIFG
ncbi:MAG: 16S rRNA (uracil(1498)-N(3))-methyltransferase [Candidatus Omnitrophica bacterium]|nr:16S rRNA (uracil(1498)-N(3))-methyltransferase [Candidatus Omnitrophota bacterium]